MTNKTLLFTVLFLMILLLIPTVYFLLQEEKTNEIIKIAPIEIERPIPKTIEAQASMREPVSNEEIFSQFAKAVSDSKRAVSNEEIAKSVLIALEKNMHKPIPLQTTTPNINPAEINLTQTTKPKEHENLKEVEIVIPKKETIPKLEMQRVKNHQNVEEKLVDKQANIEQVVLKVKDSALNADKKRDEKADKIEKVTSALPKKAEPSKLPTKHHVSTENRTERVIEKTQKIILLSKDSHASLTKVNTLIENTHPEETLEIYNGAKAYVLDESAETKDILITEEEFEQLPWSQTYGVIEESENFELEESIDLE
jgi:uncharacterized membrane protein YgaE (UPF0421/DUF939 family)